MHRARALVRRLPRRTWLAVLIALHAALLVHSARVHSPTIDEPAHLAAGVADWKTGTFDLYRVNPPLWRMAAALPVLAAGADTRFTPWFRNVDDTFRAEGIAGLDFARDNGDRYFHLLFLARLVGVAWSVLGALLVFRWARELFGEVAAHLACALWCLEPMVLGHAPLVTPDIPAAVSALAATYAFWRWVHRPSWPRALLVGVLLGIAQLTKFTNLTLYAMWPVLWLAWHLLRRRGVWYGAGARPRLRSALAQGTLVVATSLVVLNAGYGFHETGTPLGSYRFASELLSGHTFTDEDRYPEWKRTPVGNRFAGKALARLPVPVPRNYLQGIDLQRADFDRRLRSYLHGQWQYGGWWYYYFYALAIKAPLGAWALVLWGAVAAVRVSARRPQLLFCLAPPLTLLALLASQSGFSAHLRYALPAFPFLFVLAGGVARSLRAAPARALMVAGLASWSAVASLRVHPHSMSYFNEIAGGPERGSEYLVDSNVDWGQDLLLLRRWMEGHPEARPMGLAYVGPIDPRQAGVHHDYVPIGDQYPSTASERVGVQPGYFALSVNLLRGIRFSIRDRYGRLHKASTDDYRYLASLEPVARVGYSIFIYRLTSEDAAAIDRDVERQLLTQSP